MRGRLSARRSALKTKLVSTPVLAYADFSRPFILETDGSHSGLGAVLSQETDSGVRPVAYASRGLRPTERNMSNYSSMKLEFLALKWAVTEKFQEYLLGHNCVVYTDNNPLSHLQSAKLGAPEHRWAAELAVFNLEIKYRSGRSNTEHRRTITTVCACPPFGPSILAWDHGPPQHSAKCTARSFRVCLSVFDLHSSIPLCI